MHMLRDEQCEVQALFFVFSPCKIRRCVAAALFQMLSGLVYAANYLEAVSSGITASVT